MKIGSKVLTALLFALFTILILWQMLLPGYVLTLDMPWTPALDASWEQDEINNTFVVRNVLAGAAALIPSWIVQKCVLIALFFFLLYVPWRSLPIKELAPVRNTTPHIPLFLHIFGAMLYALNPWVYARMLAGQWTVLYGYMLVPLVLATLLTLLREPSQKTMLRFAGSLVLLSLFSIHFLYITGIIACAWMFAVLIKNKRAALPALTWFTAALTVFAIMSSYWIIPAAMRNAPLEARFNKDHFIAFAAAPNGSVSAPLNVAALGGFWGENEAWAYYFVWPQQYPIFWIAFACIILLAIIGFGSTLVQPRTHAFAHARMVALLIACTGVVAYVLALGAGETPLRSMTLWLYRSIPFAEGLRDSHKIAALVAYAYAVGAPAGFASALEWIPDRRSTIAPYAALAVLVLPIIFGMHMWGGFRQQLSPTWYPREWHDAKAIIDATNGNQKVLVLPWHGYFSLDFADQRIVANPANDFFGNNRVVASRNAEIGSVYDQETDAWYRTIDELIRNGNSMDRDTLRKTLAQHRVGYVLKVENTAGQVTRLRESAWQPFAQEDTPDAATLEGDWLIERAEGTLLIDGSVRLWRIGAP